MNSLIYLSKRTLINKMKQALKKPITYLYLAIILISIFSLGFTLFFGAIVLSGDGFVFIFMMALTGYVIFDIFGSIIMLAKRKGMMFTQSYAHFLFVAPISPKRVLLYTARLNFLLAFVMSILFGIAAIIIFDLSVIRGMMIFVSMYVLDVILSSALIILLYANERLSRRMQSWLSKGMWIIIGGISLYVFWYFIQHGFGLDQISYLIDSPEFQMLPIVGWTMAAYHLLLFGPTTLNVICSLLYLLMIIVLVIMAIRMQCTGKYYEDAAKYADEYAEIQKAAQGGVIFHTKKKKYGKATISYKSGGAKAIFYRRLLEYKKRKWFIFGSTTLLCIIACAVVIWIFREPPRMLGTAVSFALAAHYMGSMTSGQLKKRKKELLDSYFFLIPDTAEKKLWYTTLMEQIKALVEGCILVIPIGIVWSFSILEMIMAILVYAVIVANLLYISILEEVLIGNNVFGKVGKWVLRGTIQAFSTGLGMVFAFLVERFLESTSLAFLVMLICTIPMTGAIFLFVAYQFDQMEQVEG